ncbi:thioester dehydrase [Shewanella sp. UCD-FRSSP16_17]|uniref:ApeP family dehydratase n=1 Tax=Shewanella sp. UCD-FRSSP16_17 TaxID=1853256 RepID=UPI0007EE9E2D|nr:thioester dehydrase [Shewanella sp. UCD-FRSSP16_17]OBT05289.1 thioester dehydrase [Shewanella sp. UCD-FRSSP16_17]
MTEQQTKQIAPETLLSQDISAFVPHKAPMILVTRIIKHQPDSLTTEVEITEQSAYFNQQLNGVPNYVGIEYMAQSIAALAGVEAHLIEDKIRVGFLLGTRKLSMMQPTYLLNNTYQVDVTRLYQEASGLAVFDCQITLDSEMIASANVNVFQPQDTQAYINETLST